MNPFRATLESWERAGQDPITAASRHRLETASDALQDFAVLQFETGAHFDRAVKIGREVSTLLEEFRGDHP